MNYKNLTIDELRILIGSNRGHAKDKVTDEFLDFVKDFVETNGGTFDITILKENLNEGNIELLANINKNLSFNIDVKAATWTAIGFLLDLYVTRGISTTVLSSIGLIGQVIEKIPTENGELCNLMISKAEKLSLPKEIYSSIAQQPCVFPTHNCRYNSEGICKISESAVSTNLHDSTQKSIIDLKN